MKVSCMEFQRYDMSVAAALDEINAAERLALQNKVLIKPNLINTSPHPVTTPKAFCRALVRYVRHCAPAAEIVIAEGCGDLDMETDEVFTHLGYDELAEETGVSLLDLNHAPVVEKRDSGRPFFKKMMLPKAVFTHFVISAPVLKAHSLAGITGAIKNMMGAAPPRYYSGRFGTWKKAVFHQEMQQSLLDLYHYCPPDLSVMDATIGLSDYHLGGRQCDPPVNRILAGFDAKALDRCAAELLGIPWEDIGHLAAP